MLVISKVADTSGAMLDPKAAAWSSINPTSLVLIPTPIGNQPTPYTKTAWKDRQFGAVKAVNVQGCHDGDSIFLRLSWQDISENRQFGDGEIFPDAAGVLWPIAAEAAINTMGAEHQGVNAWQWKASAEPGTGRSVSAFGTGSSEPNGDTVRTGSERVTKGWEVVISRKLIGEGDAEHSIRLTPGEKGRLGVAVWEGGNGERAGFKAFTENWVDIQIAAA